MAEKHSKTVLIIDDEAAVRVIVARMVEREGYRALQSINGATGLKVFDREKVDLIVCDIIMPEKEGIETIREIRGKNRPVKIIAMSGGGRTKDGGSFLTMALRLGADYILPKPFSREDLASLLRSCFDPAARLPMVSAAARSRSPAIERRP